MILHFVEEKIVNNVFFKVNYNLESLLEFSNT